MSRRASTSTAIPPIYVLRAGETCPACRQNTNVYALAAAGFSDDPEDEPSLQCVVLKHINHLPKWHLAVLREHCPGWRFVREEPTALPYLMNHCLRCDAPLTDRYLHAEPGSAFFPCGPDECWNISVFVLPADGALSLRCSWTAGGLTDWLDFEAAQPLTER
jgi:hypothetical protein